MGTQAIVHIGTGKTGSTSLQKTLFSCRDDLLRQGCLVPEVEGKRLEQQALVTLFLEKGTTDASARLRDDLVAQIKRQACDHVVLSSEYIWSNPRCAEEIRDVLGGVSTASRSWPISASRCPITCR